MAETVQITLGANTTGAINAMRNFTASMANTSKGVQQLANGLSQLGANAAAATAAMGNTQVSESIAKWVGIGDAVRYAGRALVDVGKGAGSLLQKLGPRAGPVGLAAVVGGWFAKVGYDIWSAKSEREQSLKQVQEDNVKLQKLINDAIELRTKAGAFTISGANELFDRTAEAFKGDPNKTFIELVRLHDEVTSGIGNRESAKAKLAMNDLRLGSAGGTTRELELLRERRDLVRDIQKTFPAGAVGDGGVSAIQIPGPGSTDEELKNYKDILATAKELSEIENRINEIRSQGSFLLNDLAATAAGSVTTALAGVADGITGVIMGTRTWAQAMQQTAASILSSVIQMILKFTILFAIVSAMQALFPGSGFVGKFAGFAGFPGKATGGLVGSGMYQVGEKGPEYVIDNKTLNRMGTGFFQSLQNGVVPSIASVPKGMAASGGGAAGSGSSMGVNLAVLGGPGAVHQWAQTREGRAYIVDIANETIRDARS